MKNIKTITCFIGLIMSGLLSVQGQTNQEKCESLYNKWHAIREGNDVTEPNYFVTNSTISTFRELSTINREINSNKIAMAYYLCEKIAAETNYPGDAVDMLEHVSGINLWFADHPTDDIAGEITKNLTRFREEWRAGIYKDPSKQIAKLCEQRLSKESSAQINPRDLSAIRRYGIFGLPELTRQMAKNNSKQAFAAYLVIVHDEDQYRDYLEHSDQQFTNVTDKISHVSKKIDEMKAHGGGDSDVMKKTTAALADQK